MINHFISAANTHKLEILRELINSDQTLHELAETLDISTNTVKRYINELNKELADFSVHHIQKMRITAIGLLAINRQLGKLIQNLCIFTVFLPSLFSFVNYL